MHTHSRTAASLYHKQQKAKGIDTNINTYIWKVVFHTQFEITEKGHTSRDGMASSNSSLETLPSGERTRVVIGSRKSELAMIQSTHVQGLLKRAFPEVEFVIETSSTLGDDVQNVPLSVVGSTNPGLFTKNLETGIIAGVYDLAVHSLKDMPTTLPHGLMLGAITAREDPTDAVVLHPAYTSLSAPKAGDSVTCNNSSTSALSSLPTGAVVGTSSLRRQALIARMFPRLKVMSIRGNLNTRMKKLDDSIPLGQRSKEAKQAETIAEDGVAEKAADSNKKIHYDAIILATAGLKRMGWRDRISEILDPSLFPYGVSQGALGIECRANDKWMLEKVVSKVNDCNSATRCLAERAFLRGLQGGCQVPIGVSSRLDAEKGHLELRGVVLSVDGKQCIEEDSTILFTGSDSVEMANKAENLGASLAESAKKNGALALLGDNQSSRPITYSQVAE